MSLPPCQLRERLPWDTVYEVTRGATSTIRVQTRHLHAAPEELTMSTETDTASNDYFVAGVTLSDENVVNIMDFGPRATSDGSWDVRDALPRAVAALRDLGSGRVHWPTGDYEGELDHPD